MKELRHARNVPFALRKYVATSGPELSGGPDSRWTWEPACGAAREDASGRATYAGGGDAGPARMTYAGGGDTAPSRVTYAGGGDEGKARVTVPGTGDTTPARSA